MKKVLQTLIIALTIASTAVVNSYAHSGRTDGNGGHRDNKNKSGLGSYHYHCGGYGPHLHPNGVCPYSGGATKATTETKPAIDTIVVSNAPSSIKVGEQYDLSYSITGSSKSAGTWSTSDKSIIDVSSSGALYAKGVGSATVTLSTSNNSKSFTVTVEPIQVEAVTLSETSTEIQLGNSKTITAAVHPDNATNKTLTWKSADYNIASVDQDGKITAVAPGETIISAVSNNNIVAEIAVKSYEKLPESIELDSDSFKVEMTKTLKLEPKVMPEDANYDGVTFECDNTDVATIDSNGEITPVSLGQANITITARNISKQVPIEVFETNAKSIEIVKNSDDFFAGNHVDIDKEFTLQAITYPNDATYKDFTWTSSNPEVIEVSEDGKFKSLKEGNATITVHNEDGVESSIDITVTSKNKFYGLGFCGFMLLGGAGGFFGYKKGILKKLKK